MKNGIESVIFERLKGALSFYDGASATSEILVAADVLADAVEDVIRNIMDNNEALKPEITEYLDGRNV